MRINLIIIISAAFVSSSVFGQESFLKINAIDENGVPVSNTRFFYTLPTITIEKYFDTDKKGTSIITLYNIKPGFNILIRSGDDEYIYMSSSWITSKILSGKLNIIVQRKSETTSKSKELSKLLSQIHHLSLVVSEMSQNLSKNKLVMAAQVKVIKELKQQIEQLSDAYNSALDRIINLLSDSIAAFKRQEVLVARLASDTIRIAMLETKIDELSQENLTLSSMVFHTTLNINDLNCNSYKENENNRIKFSFDVTDRNRRLIYDSTLTFLYQITKVSRQRKDVKYDTLLNPENNSKYFTQKVVPGKKVIAEIRANYDYFTDDHSDYFIDIYDEFNSNNLRLSGLFINSLSAACLTCVLPSNDRCVEVVNDSIISKSKRVRLEIWDNGDIDGDEVSVYNYNHPDHKIFKGAILGSVKSSDFFELDEGENIIILYADKLGSKSKGDICNGTIRIFDEANNQITKYVNDSYFLHSDYKTSQAIKIVFKK